MDYSSLELPLPSKVPIWENKKPLDQKEIEDFIYRSYVERFGDWASFSNFSNYNMKLADAISSPLVLIIQSLMSRIEQLEKIIQTK